MKRALAAAVGGILLVPATPFADDSLPPAAPPPPAAQEMSKPPAPAAPEPEPVAKQRPKPPAKPKPEPKAHAAASGSVTIENFAFAPPSISVTAGDTVTWVNRDRAPHTATGSGGSFNTGTLRRGKSGSHTFSKPGRFAYICAIHPNMRATVVVAAASSPQAAPKAAPAAAASGPKAPAGPTLPNSGLQSGVVALLGALMTAAGAGLRRLLRLV